MIMKLNGINESRCLDFIDFLLLMFSLECKKLFLGNGTGSCLSSACGGTYENFTSCDIQSPGYPSSYSSNLNCTWLIKAPHPNQIISVEFLQLNLNEVNSACRMNNVTFYDISSNKLSVISESVCDMDLNRLKNKKIRSKGVQKCFL